MLDPALVILLLARVAALALGSVLVASTVLSAVRTVVVPRAHNTLITRGVFGVTRLLFEGLLQVRRRRSYARVDSVMSLYAPTALLLLPVTWISIVLVGFTFVYWGVGVESVSLAFLLSGSAVLTLGSTPAPTLLTSILAYLEATIGLILVALLISYLPTMYAAFARREREVALLEVRAGTPPSALTMLERIHRLGRWGVLHDVWLGWELWFTDVEESHTSLAALSFFRSPRADHHWVVAAGTVLDTASLTASTLDIPHDPQADLCIRAGYIALRRIAAFFDLPYDEDPLPDGPISISREAFDEAYDELLGYGVPLKADRDQCWRDFAGWRVNYDRPLVGLARLLLAPRAPTWTGELGPAELGGRPQVGEATVKKAAQATEKSVSPAEAVADSPLGVSAGVDPSRSQPR